MPRLEGLVGGFGCTAVVVRCGIYGGHGSATASFEAEGKRVGGQFEGGNCWRLRRTWGTNFGFKIEFMSLSISIEA